MFREVGPLRQEEMHEVGALADLLAERDARRQRFQPLPVLGRRFHGQHLERLGHAELLGQGCA